MTATSSQVRTTITIVLVLAVCGARAVSPLGHHVAGDGFKKSFQNGFQQEYGDSAKHQGGGLSGFEGVYKADGGHVGHDGHKKVGGFDHNVGSQHRNEQDQGYYKDLSGQNKQFNNGHQFGGATDFHTNGKQQSGLSNKGSHKKGHKKEGFENSHHKEESGKTTTFFDESSDGGDHFTSKGSDDHYGNQGGDSFQGGYRKGGLVSNGGGKQGHFGGGYSFDDQKGHKGSVGQEGYSNDYKGFGSQGGYNSGKKFGVQSGFGGSGQHGEGYNLGSVNGHHGGLGYGGGLVGGGGLGGGYGVGGGYSGFSRGALRHRGIGGINDGIENIGISSRGIGLGGIGGSGKIGHIEGIGIGGVGARGIGVGGVGIGTRNLGSGLGVGYGKHIDGGYSDGIAQGGFVGGY